VKTSSGISANGMPKERKTWLRTRALVALNPTPISTRAGIMVIARRTKIGIWRWMKPCITTWPDIVPTQEDATPDASRATPDTVPLCAPRYWFRPPNTWPRSLPVPNMPREWKTAAAVASMARLMTPAIPIAIVMSTISYRKIVRRAAGLAPTIRFWVREECR
jgi:hypothetical protein